MIAFLATTSCKKSNSQAETDNPNPNQTCKVNSVTRYAKTFHYTYDEKGKIIRIDRGTRQSTDYATLSYKTEEITIYDSKFSGSSPAAPHTTTYKLDANGKITSSGYFTFKYNAEGYLSEISYNAAKQILTYQNGNLVKIDYYSPATGTSVSTSTVIDYSSETPASEVTGFGYHLENHILYYDVLAPYFGKASKNQFIKVSKTYNEAKPIVTQVTNFVYRKDNNGNLASIAANGDNAGDVSFNYQCQ